MDNWINILEEEIKKTSLRKTALKIGYSPTTLCMVLKGNYSARTERIKDAVIKNLMNQSIFCQVLGEISLKECEKRSNTKFNPNNPINIAFFKACRNCVNNKRKETK